MKITILKRGKKFMLGLPQREQHRIADAIFKLPQGDTKLLEGEKNAYRLRVGKWRIVYQILDDEVIIRDIGSRGDIYK